jgi:hypothetical protein
MTGTLLTMPVLRAIDQNGDPMAGAQLQFYLTGTTTPAPVYSDSTLATPLANPVVADSGGLFAPIYMDPTVTYRCQLLSGAGVLIRDIDPVSSVPEIGNGSITGAQLAGGAAVANLGFAPLAASGGVATNLVLSNNNLAIYSAGYMGLPINNQGGNYQTVLLDAGCMVRMTAGSGAATFTIPLNIYPWGSAICFRNAGNGVVTLTMPSGGTLIKAGATASQASIALAPGALCTAMTEATNTWVVSGVGLT